MVLSTGSGGGFTIVSSVSPCLPFKLVRTPSSPFPPQNGKIALWMATTSEASMVQILVLVDNQLIFTDITLLQFASVPRESR